MEENKKDNSAIKKILKFSLFIILIIIILLLHSCTGFDTINNHLIPTGNIDIFDIIIDKNCENKECNCFNNKKYLEDSPQIENDIPKDDNEKKSEEEIIPKEEEKKDPEEVIEEEEEIEDEPAFYEEEGRALIYDSIAEYKNSHELRIFSNPAYNFNQIIAPGSTNVYQFIVRNNNDFAINYNIKMTELNEYNINMKYRLKKNNQYVVGDDNSWETYEKLQLSDFLLGAKEKDVYQLEWMWFESDNFTDTLIGKIGTNYSLSIHFDGEEVIA